MNESLTEALLRYEAELISRALAEANGRVTQAARLLGVPHQKLCRILKTRQKSLISARTPIRERRKPLIGVDRDTRKAKDRAEKKRGHIVRGRPGGLKGGKARAAKLSAEERRAIAQKAVRARWEKRGVNLP